MDTKVIFVEFILLMPDNTSLLQPIDHYYYKPQVFTFQYLQTTLSKSSAANFIKKT